MTISIDWYDVTVSRRLPDGDVVTARFEPTNDPSKFEVVLQLAAHKTWWKGVQILDNTYAEVGFLEVQDSTKEAGPAVFVSDDVEVGGRLKLWKAKAFGVHTEMYELADLERLRGQRVTFRWSAD
jgi:hypothetical protein